MREPASSAGKLRERIPCAHNAEGFTWSQLLNEARTFFERNSD